MNKKFSILLNILKISFIGVFVVLVILPNFYAKAEASDNITVTATNLKSDSVIVKIVENHVLQTTYRISVDIGTSSTPPYYKFVNTKTDINGVAKASFSGLNPGGTYVIIVSWENVMQAPPYTFITPPQSSPKITSFSPSSGIVGATVNIKGTNLTPVDGVLFGVIPVNSLDVHPVSENELNVKVPENAKDGQITVKTGANGNAVSPLSFIVKNDSNIVLTPTTIGPTSVTIGASGLVAEDFYVFYIKDLDGVSVISKFDIGAKGNADGTAEVSFQTILPEHNYEVRLDTKAGTTVSSVSFATPNDPNSGMENLSIVSSTATTVDLKADKLVSGNTYEIYLVNNTALTPNTSYNQKKTAVITNESATVNFSGLVANNNYTAYIIKNNEDKAFLGRVYFVSKVTTKMDNTGKKPAVFSGIVPLCNTGIVDQSTGKFPVPCDFTYLMKLINSIINFLLFKIATPLIALIIMYTGYLYITAGGSTGQTEKVRHILFSAVIGYVIALSAWLIVNTILSSLGVDSSINTFLK